MTAKRLQIQAREREHMGIITSLADFQWTAADDVEAETLLQNPDIRLYCLDPESQCAIFTALPAGIDLSRLPCDTDLGQRRRSTALRQNNKPSAHASIVIDKMSLRAPHAASTSR